MRNVVGKIKEATGEIVGDFDLFEEGEKDQMKGHIIKERSEDIKERSKKS